MGLFEDIYRYLPYWLSDKELGDLFRELEHFPLNLDARVYSSKIGSEPLIYQGDGISNLPHVLLPNTVIVAGPGLVLSNTCDVAPENTGSSAARITYCPIVPLSEYRDTLIETGQYGSAMAADDFIDSIKSQKVTSCVFLPPVGDLPEMVALFEYVLNCDLQELGVANLLQSRRFSLSQYGHYLLLIKASIHWTRLRDEINRG